MFSINLPNLVGWLQETLMKDQKLFWNYSFYLEGQALRKKQRALWKAENERKYLIFDFECTGCQSTPQHLLNTNLLNLVSLLQETLVKQQKIFHSYSFWLEGQFQEKSKEDCQTEKNCANTFYLILGALVGRTRPKSVKYRFIKFDWLTRRDPNKGAKVILKTYSF